MMFGKVISKSGRKIVKAIKNLSNGKLAKKLQAQESKQYQERCDEWSYMASEVARQNLNNEMDSISYDVKSIDTFVTYIAADAFPYEECYMPYCCCHCYELEENQMNENLENERMSC